MIIFASKEIGGNYHSLTKHLEAASQELLQLNKRKPLPELARQYQENTVIKKTPQMLSQISNNNNAGYDEQAAKQWLLVFLSQDFPVFQVQDFQKCLQFLLMIHQHSEAFAQDELWNKLIKAILSLIQLCQYQVYLVRNDSNHNIELFVRYGLEAGKKVPLFDAKEYNEFCESLLTTMLQLSAKQAKPRQIEMFIVMSISVCPSWVMNAMRQCDMSSLLSNTSFLNPLIGISLQSLFHGKMQYLDFFNLLIVLKNHDALAQIKQSHITNLLIFVNRFCAGPDIPNHTLSVTSNNNNDDDLIISASSSSAAILTKLSDENNSTVNYKALISALLECLLPKFTSLHFNTLFDEQADFLNANFISIIVIQLKDRLHTHKLPWLLKWCDNNPSSSVCNTLYESLYDELVDSEFASNSSNQLCLKQYQNLITGTKLSQLILPDEPTITVKQTNSNNKNRSKKQKSVKPKLEFKNFIATLKKHTKKVEQIILKHLITRANFCKLSSKWVQVEAKKMAEEIIEYRHIRLTDSDRQQLTQVLLSRKDEKFLNLFEVLACANDLKILRWLHGLIPGDRLKQSSFDHAVEMLLTHASYKNSLAIMRFLLSINCPLSEFCSGEKRSSIGHLLQNPNLNDTDLHNLRNDLLMLIINAGADVNAISPAKGKFSVISFAAMLRCPKKIFQILIKHGADINFIAQYMTGSACNKVSILDIIYGRISFHPNETHLLQVAKFLEKAGCRLLSGPSGFELTAGTSHLGRETVSCLASKRPNHQPKLISQLRGITDEITLLIDGLSKNNNTDFSELDKVIDAHPLYYIPEEALQIAIDANNEALACHLIQNFHCNFGVHRAFPNNFIASFFEYAIDSELYQVVSCMLASGANVNGLFYNGGNPYPFHVPIIHAMFKFNLNIIYLLLQHNATVTLTSEQLKAFQLEYSKSTSLSGYKMMMPIFDRERFRHPTQHAKILTDDILYLLLKPTQPDPGMLLRTAAFIGDIPQLKKLLADNPGSINSQSTLEKNSALHYAAVNHKYAALCFLAKTSGVDLQITNKANQTPFDVLLSNADKSKSVIRTDIDVDEKKRAEQQRYFEEAKDLLSNTGSQPLELDLPLIYRTPSYANKPATQV